MSQDQYPRSSEEIWRRLSQVAVQGAKYDSLERYPHPKCLAGTRVDLLKHIHTLLDKREKSQLIWLHGTAGVGKSAVAFTVAEMMRNLKAREESTVEKRLAGTFFFSRKHTKRCTTGYFFATLVYQLASNFPSIRSDVNEAIRENPALLDPDNSLRDQMEAFFLRPLRRLKSRLSECPPLTFVIDALDECTSKPELIDLVLFLARALREPALPVTHILLTSRSESHISEAFEQEEVRPLVCEIPVKISGEGIATIISLDGADVDKDIYTFLQHSFRELQRRHPDFPQPTADQLAQLASRAGRRFIVAATMIKFIADGYNDPHGRLQLMLKLTNELLPGTEIYRFYDRILSTCADPKRAYMHLSVVAALADPLPMSQISKLLGPGLGRDVKTALMQLRSVMDIPTDDSLPVNIHHSSIRDYISSPSNCSLSEVCNISSPHSLLAESCLRLMTREIPKSTALLDMLSQLKGQSQAMQPRDPKRLKDSLAFLVRPPEPMSVLIGMLWLRGDRSSDLRPWVEALDGHDWLYTEGGREWLYTEGGREWLDTKGGREWLDTERGQEWLDTERGREWLDTEGGREWLDTEGGRMWRKAKRRREWLKAERGREWLKVERGREWLDTEGGREWLDTEGGREWLDTERGREWLDTERGREWQKAESGREWQKAEGGREWLKTEGGREWLKTYWGREWLKNWRGQEWLQTPRGQEWLQTPGGQKWLQTPGGQEWLQTHWGREWLLTQRGQEWLQTPHGQAWQSTPAASVWVIMEEFSRILQGISDSEHIIVPEPHLPSAFQAVQQFKSLPDFLMFPVFVALGHHDHSNSALPRRLLSSDREIIRAMNTFTTFANEAQQQSRAASDALKYACQNWVVHLSHASNPWDDELNSKFQAFWNHHLLSWLTRQWCLKGLPSCLVILSEGQKLAKRNPDSPIKMPGAWRN